MFLVMRMFVGVPVTWWCRRIIISLSERWANWNYLQQQHADLGRTFSVSEAVLKATPRQPLLDLFEVCEPRRAARIWCHSRSPAGWDHRHKLAADITLCQQQGGREGGRHSKHPDTVAAFRVCGNKYCCTFKTTSWMFSVFSCSRLHLTVWFSKCWNRSQDPGAAFTDDWCNKKVHKHVQKHVITARTIKKIVRDLNSDYFGNGLIALE